MNDLYKDLGKVFTKDIAYPKNKAQMEKAINQLQTAANKVTKNMEQIEKLAKQNKELYEQFRSVFSYLGEESGGWVDQLNKWSEVTKCTDILDDGRRQYERI